MENKLIEKNLGRVSGLSSYELAVKNGTFSGTEEDYVKKEQQVYQDMLKYSDKSVAQMKQLLSSATDNDSDTNAEIINSRGQFDTLNDRLNDSDNTLNTIMERLNAGAVGGDCITDAIIDDDGYLTISLKPSGADSSYVGYNTIQLRKAGEQLQWRTNETGWKTLVYLRELMPKIGEIEINSIDPTDKSTGTIVGDPDNMKMVLNIPRGENGGDILDAKVDNEGVLWLTIANHDAVLTDANKVINGLPMISIGTVTTIDPDQSASVEISGTPTNPILNFSIPRGVTPKLNRAYLGDDGFLVFDYDQE